MVDLLKHRLKWQILILAQRYPRTYSSEQNTHETSAHQSLTLPSQILLLPINNPDLSCLAVPHRSPQQPPHRPPVVVHLGGIKGCTSCQPASSWQWSLSDMKTAGPSWSWCPGPRYAHAYNVLESGESTDVITFCFNMKYGSWMDFNTEDAKICVHTSYVVDHKLITTALWKGLDSLGFIIFALEMGAAIYCNMQI